MLMSTRKFDLDLDSNLNSILELRDKENGSIIKKSDEELAKMFLKKLITRNNISVGEGTTNSHRMTKKEFKKSFHSMKEFQRFLCRCFECKGPFMNYSPYLESIKSNKRKTNRRNTNSNIESKEELESGPAKHVILRNLSTIRERRMSFKHKNAEASFVEMAFKKPDEYLQFRVYKHPEELRLYRKEIIDYPKNYKYLFRKFYGRFTFYDHIEIACYYLGFSKKRQTKPSLRVIKSVNCNFQAKKFHFHIYGAGKMYIKYDQIISKLFEKFPKKIYTKLLKSLDIELKNLLSFIKQSKFNFDYCWLKIEVLQEMIIEQDRKRYLMDLYFDDTKNMREDMSGEKFFKKVFELSTNCEKILQRRKNKKV